MGIVQIHASIATTVMLYNVVVGLWGLFKFLRKQDYIDGNYWGAIALSPVLGLVQALLGIVMIGMGLASQVRLVHYLYGALVVITVPATFAFTRGRDDRGALILYAAILLLTAIFGARAYTTAFGAGF
jgi:heme A synthase